MSLFAVLVGCSTWSESGLPDLPMPRMPQDSVVLETAFVRVPHETPLEELWREIDEQQFEPELRKSLAANGVRVGIVGTQIPNALATLLSGETQMPGDDPLLSTTATALQQQLQSRSGERSELIVVPNLKPGTTVLITESGNIRATRFDDGQALLTLRTHPAGDGTVRIELCPIVKHGQVRRQYAPANGAYRYDFRREEFSFDQQRFDATLSPGQSLLVTSTEDSKGLGNLLFIREDESRSERLLLLIRLAQTQYNDLFDSQAAREPFTTPVD